MSGMLPVKGLYAFIYTLEAPWWAQAVCVRPIGSVCNRVSHFRGFHFSLAQQLSNGFL